MCKHECVVAYKEGASPGCMMMMIHSRQPLTPPPPPSEEVVVVWEAPRRAVCLDDDYLLCFLRLLLRPVSSGAPRRQPASTARPTARLGRGRRLCRGVCVCVWFLAPCLAGGSLGGQNISAALRVTLSAEYITAIRVAAAALACARVCVCWLPW